MNHYRSRHSPHDRQPEQGVFSIECLDPQLDSLVDTISREVAAHQPVVLLKGIHSVEEQAKFEMERSEANASLQWSKYTSSLLLGVGLLGFALSLPSLQIGRLKFDLPVLVIAAFCTSIGAGCMMMVRMSQTVTELNDPSAILKSVSKERTLDWILGTLGILFLVSASLVFSTNRNDSLVLPTVLRLGLVGLTCSTISLQMQFMKLLQSRLANID